MQPLGCLQYFETQAHPHTWGGWANKTPNPLFSFLETASNFLGFANHKPTGEMKKPEALWARLSHSLLGNPQPGYPVGDPPPMFAAGVGQSWEGA